MNIEIKEIVKEKKPRGRPAKIKEIIKPEMIEPEIKEIKKIPRGRPKQFNISVKQYNALYYLKNKDKTKGTCLCDVCNVLISKSNKSRHFASTYHQKMIDFHINEVHEVLDIYNENTIEENQVDEYLDELIKEM